MLEISTSNYKSLHTVLNLLLLYYVQLDYDHKRPKHIVATYLPTIAELINLYSGVYD